MMELLAAEKPPKTDSQRDGSCPHVVFTGGGTGGHLFPGLAVADELRKLAPNIRVSFVGRGTAFERSEVLKAGYEFTAIAAQPMPKRPWQAVGFLANHLACTREATCFLRRHSTALVVGLGGYASVPASKGAVALGIPLVLLEQNAVAGRANRWLATKATLICSAFEVERPWKAACPIKIIGNPVRRGFGEVQSLRLPQAARRLRLIVLGGSQGARVLNEQVPRALYKVGPTAHSWQIVHQSGQRDLENTTSLYRKLGLTATVEPFLHKLPILLGGSDLVVSRAGGTTLAELSVSGVPAVLIPYPSATNDHQRKNADRFVATGAARLIDARELAGRLDNRLAEVLTELMIDSKLRQGMSNAMRLMARPTAAQDAAGLIHDLLCQNARREAS